MFALSLACCAWLTACADNSPAADAGTPVVDAGGPTLSCDSPEDCRVQGSDGVCRQNVCVSQVPCFDDAECGLGESCVEGGCHFTGCVEDADCAVGRCRKDVYACTECSTNDQCPASSPVCTDEGHCVKCQQDADCHYPGPPYCEVGSGACVYCQNSDQCPNGLSCGPKGVCVGQQKNQSCNAGIACDLGLMCVNVGSNSICLESCNLYTPKCGNGEICIKLTFQDSPSLVFDQGAPVGVCYPPVQGLRGYHEACNDNCQPNLACVADSATQKTCKQYCDPANPFCAQGEKCHPWPGDYAGHQYGLCYPDTGYADKCEGDSDCRTGQACVPRDDPSTFTDLSNACAYAVGAKPGLSPCTQSSECASGSCRNDPATGPNSFFCFAACAEDSDCAIDGRTGYCDTDFLFTTEYIESPGEPVRGCRPSCASPAECESYDPGLTCVASLQPKSTSLKSVCSPPIGKKLLGETCSSNSECRDGLCLQQDARGIYHDGVCSHPCTSASDCVPPPLTDGGMAGIATACGDATLPVSPGNDSSWNTADDLVATAKLCIGSACSDDVDCATPFSSCTAQPDPSNPSGNLITVCRAPSQFGSVAGGGSCVVDSNCRSGVCGELVAGGGKVCLQPCSASQSSCTGGMTCQPGAVQVKRPDGTYQSFEACAP